MNHFARFAIALATLCLLTACNTTTTTNAPDINSVQPTQQDIQQDRLNKAMQS